MDGYTQENDNTGVGFYTIESEGFTGKGWQEWGRHERDRGHGQQAQAEHGWLDGCQIVKKVWLRLEGQCHAKVEVVGATFDADS